MGELGGNLRNVLADLLLVVREREDLVERRGDAVNATELEAKGLTVGVITEVAEVGKCLLE